MISYYFDPISDNPLVAIGRINDDAGFLKTECEKYKVPVAEHVLMDIQSILKDFAVRLGTQRICFTQDDTQDVTCLVAKKNCSFPSQDEDKKISRLWSGPPQFTQTEVNWFIERSSVTIPSKNTRLDQKTKFLKEKIALNRKCIDTLVQSLPLEQPPRIAPVVAPMTTVGPPSTVQDLQSSSSQRLDLVDRLYSENKELDRENKELKAKLDDLNKKLQEPVHIDMKLMNLSDYYEKFLIKSIKSLQDGLQFGVNMKTELLTGPTSSTPSSGQTLEIQIGQLMFCVPHSKGTKLTKGFYPNVNYFYKDLFELFGYTHHAWSISSKNEANYPIPTLLLQAMISISVKRFPNISMRKATVLGESAHKKKISDHFQSLRKNVTLYQKVGEYNPNWPSAKSVLKPIGVHSDLKKSLPEILEAIDDELRDLVDNEDACPEDIANMPLVVHRPPVSKRKHSQTGTELPAKEKKGDHSSDEEEESVDEEKQ